MFTLVNQGPTLSKQYIYTPTINVYTWWYIICSTVYRLACATCPTLAPPILMK
jgi:hypothetical protein